MTPAAVWRLGAASLGVAALALGLVLIGTSANGGIPVQLISYGGPHAIGAGQFGAPPVIVSTSLSDLQQRVDAVPSYPRFDECKQRGWTDWPCWNTSKLPANSLLFAVEVSPGFGCADGTLTGAVLAGNTLTVTDQVAGSFGGSPNCQSYGTSYSLAAAPLSRFSTGTLAVVIHYVTPAGCKSCQIADAKATILIPGHVP
jgi:hypothetical protein